MGRFQSTRPRGARPRGRVSNRGEPTISIHAPAWGATLCGAVTPPKHTNFNPRARVGRDWRAMRGMDARQHFNPRARVGRDTARNSSVSFCRHFNPRARVGRDRPCGRHACRSQDFNPRARVGRDKWFLGRILSVRNFNPRARVGRDAKRSGDVPRFPISIHAPAWGATGQRLPCSSTMQNFNPRARVGRDGSVL